MALEHPPQDRQDALVGHERLPGRLDHPALRGRDVLGERIGEHLLPRIELEERADHPVLGVGELAARGDADVLERHVMRDETRLLRGPRHVLDRREILVEAASGGEVQVGARREHRAEALHHRLVNAVELVSVPRQRARGAHVLRRALKELAAPLRDLVRMNVELLGQLGQRLLALDGRYRHLRLERRGVVPPWSSHHGRSSVLSNLLADLEQLHHSAPPFRFPEPPLTQARPIARTCWWAFYHRGG